jgi:DNA-binding GntR family transcriptional regulator
MAQLPLTESIAETNGGLQVIPRVSLKKKAVASIRQAIERGELKAGETLTELGLARRLGVGQPTIREALIELEFLGFIERQGRRKTRVTLLNRQAIKDIYQVRARLETLAIELVAQRKSADLADAWSQIERMEESAKSGQAFDLYQADLAFHRAIWAQASNESLRICLEQLVPKLLTFSIIQQAEPSLKKLTEIAADHRAILESVAAGHVQDASNRMAASMRSAQEDDEHLPGLN